MLLVADIRSKNGKGHAVLATRPLFMSATAYSPTRVQYNQQQISMEFRLVYDGQLRSGQGGGSSANKHEIRKAIHQQLAKLWEAVPDLKMRSSPHSILNAPPAKGIAGHAGHSVTMAAAIERPSLWETLGSQFRGCDYRFVPLVSNHLKLTCSLDILLLWQDRIVPVGPAGDIDNRLKTLFDALQIPQSCSDVDPPTERDEFLFVLLENDNLITDVRVTTDRMLTPYVRTPGQGASHPENFVRLVINVKVQPSIVGFENLAFLS
jgi:hypothetical protein